VISGAFLVLRARCRFGKEASAIVSREGDRIHSSRSRSRRGKSRCSSVVRRENITFSIRLFSRTDRLRVSQAHSLHGRRRAGSNTWWR